MSRGRNYYSPCQAARVHDCWRAGKSALSSGEFQHHKSRLNCPCSLTLQMLMWPLDFLVLAGPRTEEKGDHCVFSIASFICFPAPILDLMARFPSVSTRLSLEFSGVQT